MSPVPVGKKPPVSAVNPQGSGYRWVIMALALTSFTLTFVCRFAWPPLVPEIMPLMKINRTEAMAYMTAFYIGYVITQIPSGLLTDLFGPRLILFIALLAFGGASSGISALLAACVIGFMVTFLNPVFTVILADNADPEWSATAAGVSNTIYQIAAILSPLIIGLAADARGNYGLTWIILAAGALIGVV